MHSSYGDTDTETNLWTRVPGRGEGEEDERVGWIVRVTLKRIHDSM